MKPSLPFTDAHILDCVLTRAFDPFSLLIGCNYKSDSRKFIFPDCVVDVSIDLAEILISLKFLKFLRRCVLPFFSTAALFVA
jgi:hypothetical protein